MKRKFDVGPSRCSPRLAGDDSSTIISDACTSHVFKRRDAGLNTLRSSPRVQQTNISEVDSSGTMAKRSKVNKKTVSVPVRSSPRFKVSFVEVEAEATKDCSMGDVTSTQCASTASKQPAVKSERVRAVKQVTEVIDVSKGEGKGNVSSRRLQKTHSVDVQCSPKDDLSKVSKKSSLRTPVSVPIRSSPRKKVVFVDVEPETPKDCSSGDFTSTQSKSRASKKPSIKRQCVRNVKGVRKSVERSSSQSKVSCRKTLPSATTRMSPRTFVYVLERLNFNQWESLQDIGFGGLYWLRVKRLPMKLGYWLIDNFNPYSNNIMLPDGQRLSITASSVHDTFGLPMGPNPVILHRSSKEYDPFDEFYSNWKLQFGVHDGEVEVQKLAEYILKNDDSGDLFKINFVVLAVSYLIRNNQRPFVNFRVLKSLVNPSEISQLNWCEFVMDSLRVSKKNWDRKRNHFGGPLLFLMVRIYFNLLIFI